MAARSQADVVVVGAGVMGLAAAWALARDGRDVLVLEQFRVGHARGSSHGQARIFRLAYDESEWILFARDALRGWRELERETGQEMLALDGLLDIGRDPAPLAAALEAAGTAYEVLDAGEVERRFGLRLEPRPVVFQPDAGVVYAGWALGAFRACAERRGAEIREQAKVSALEPTADGVVVHTDAGSVEARVAVVTAGAWARRLLEPLDLDLPVVVTRETVAYFQLAESRPVPSMIDHRAPDANEWGLQVGGQEIYSLPDREGVLKVGLLHSGPAADPDVPGSPDEAVVRVVTNWAGEIFPLAHSDAVSADTCLFTTTADSRFVLERHGAIVVASACSGHGFKFAPAVGARIAELAGLYRR